MPPLPTASLHAQGSDSVPEKVVIIGSGPAGWAAAIYASRANLEPLLFEGAMLQEHYDNGRPPRALGTRAMDFDSLSSA